MDFSTFKNKYVITGELTVKTALHIGSGKEKDDRDAPFISLDDDKNFYRLEDIWVRNWKDFWIVEMDLRLKVMVKS